MQHSDSAWLQGRCCTIITVVLPPTHMLYMTQTHSHLNTCTQRPMIFGTQQLSHTNEWLEQHRTYSKPFKWSTTMPWMLNKPQTSNMLVRVCVLCVLCVVCVCVVCVYYLKTVYYMVRNGDQCIHISVLSACHFNRNLKNKYRHMYGMFMHCTKRMQYILV